MTYPNNDYINTIDFNDSVNVSDVLFDRIPEIHTFISTDITGIERTTAIHFAEKLFTQTYAPIGPSVRFIILAMQSRGVIIDVQINLCNTNGLKFREFTTTFCGDAVRHRSFAYKGFEFDMIAAPKERWIDGPVATCAVYRLFSTKCAELSAPYCSSDYHGKVYTYLMDSNALYKLDHVEFRT